MRWRTGRRSENVEDRRDEGGGLGDPFGSGRAPAGVGRTLGIGGGRGGLLLVLFTGTTRSACGLGEAAMGPFYCPADQLVCCPFFAPDQPIGSVNPP